MAISSSRNYQRYVWDETRGSFVFMKDDFDFGRIRISYSSSDVNRPHIFIYNSHVDCNIVVITNLSLNDNTFNKHLRLACARFYDYLVDYRDWLRRHGRQSSAFHLDLLEDKVIQIEEIHGHYG